MTVNHGVVGSSPTKVVNFVTKNIVYSLNGKISICGIEDIGSIPIRRFLKRVWCNGNIRALGVLAMGSTPITLKAV